MRDLRKYARQTNVRLIAGALFLLFVVGDGLIYFIYGPAAAVTGFLCLLGGLVPIVLVVLVLALLDWITRRLSADSETDSSTDSESDKRTETD
jgi:membrane protein implicated in regulation of membrane protease activity